MDEGFENCEKIRKELNQSIRKIKRVAEINLARYSNKGKKKVFTFYKFENNSSPFKIDENVSLVQFNKLVNLFNAYFALVFTDNSLKVNVLECM